MASIYIYKFDLLNLALSTEHIKVASLLNDSAKAQSLSVWNGHAISRLISTIVCGSHLLVPTIPGRRASRCVTSL